MANLTDETKKHLHNQLVKLGDMMGDGLHHDADGRWIAKEYARVAKALGYGPPRKNNTEAINKAMAAALEKAKCQCGASLKQSRSGSMRADCTVCPKRYQFKRGKKK